jgi:hypothetical protein
MILTCVAWRRLRPASSNGRLPTSSVRFPVRHRSGRLSAHSAPSQTRSRAGPCSAGNIQSGKRIYADYYAVCHGKDGRGDRLIIAMFGPKPFAFTDKAGMATKRDDEVSGRTQTRSSQPCSVTKMAMRSSSRSSRCRTAAASLSSP